MPADLREAQAVDLPAIYALRGRAFGQGTDPAGTRAAWFGRHDREDPWRDAGANYVALDDGQIVATLRVFARRLRFGTTTLAVAGLGDVATEPAAQARGHMRRLLAYVNAQNATRGFDLGLIFTGKWRVYEGAGFRRLPATWYTLPLPLTGAPPRPGGSWAVMPGDAANLGALRTVDEAFGRGRPGYLVRDDAFWGHRARAASAPDEHWLGVARDGAGAIGAYLLASRRLWGGQDVIVAECPYAPGAAEAATLLLAALATSPFASGHRAISGALPGDHALCTAGATLPGQVGRSDLTMVRAYSERGARAEAVLRREATDRWVYWIADYF